MIGTLLISWTGINVACLATNSQILITNKESADDGEGAVLDADTVSKINELMHTQSSIIMMTLKMRNCRMDCIQV